MTAVATVSFIASTQKPWQADLGQRKIVFDSQRDGNRDIYVMDANGSNVRRLTQTYGKLWLSWKPKWSPDRTRIAFQSNRDGAAAHEIYVMERILDRKKEMGTVERGKVADLILLDANPLEDILNTRRINGVVTNGRYLPKEALQKMLAEVEADVNKKSIAETVSATIIEKGIAAALEQYRELREKRSDTYELDEDEMNDVGYRLLRMKKVSEAIEIFKLNVEAFPKSSNVYDSLGEGCMVNGDKELAIKNYQKSVELNPQNTNGIEMLKKLQAK